MASRRARRGENHGGEVRFPARPSLRELEVALPSSIPRSPSLSLEYRGTNARYVKSRYFIITVTHHIVTLKSLTVSFFLSQVAWSCPRTKTRIVANTISLFVIISWFSPRHNELE